MSKDTTGKSESIRKNWAPGAAGKAVGTLFTPDELDIYVNKAIEAGDKSAAQTVYQRAVSTIDSIADKNIIHKNKAARHKSRLSAAIKGMA